jgi:hypothetical protein
VCPLAPSIGVENAVTGTGAANTADLLLLPNADEVRPASDTSRELSAMTDKLLRRKLRANEPRQGHELCTRKSGNSGIRPTSRGSSKRCKDS